MSALAAPAPAQGAAARAYAPGWVHGLVAWVDRLPGPRWLAYVTFAVALILILHVPLWSEGKVPAGALDRVYVFYGILPVINAFIYGYLERSARSGFEGFRAALTATEAEADVIRYRLSTIPLRVSVIAAGLAVFMTLGEVLSDTEASGVVGLPAATVAMAVILQSFNVAVLLQLLYWLVRQMRLVRQLLDTSLAVDVFRPAPLHAVATLTARPGAAITVVIAVFALVVPTDLADLNSFLVAWAPYVVIPPIVAGITFVAPLMGAHARLDAQKERLLDEADGRIQSLLADLHRDVEARALERSDAYNKALATLLIERDLLGKLSTWPWSTATLRSFLSAIGLPLGLFLVQEALSRLF